VELNPARAVDEVEERRLAVAAAGGEATGQPERVLALLPRLELLVAREYLGDRRRARVARRERVDPGRAQLLELVSSLVAGVVRLLVRRVGQSAEIFVILSLRAGPRGTATLTTSPRLRPISAAPTGDSFESLFSAGSASAEPTIWYATD